jgi:malonyl-CoA decarboxylase
LKTYRQDNVEAPESALLTTLDSASWNEVDALRYLIEPLAARYLLEARKSGRPLDPVARFHLGNGAKLERINWLGDRSEKALREAAGLMVNYLYDLDEIERNHEAYANRGEVIASAQVRKLLKPESTAKVVSPPAVARQT